MDRGGGEENLRVARGDLGGSPYRSLLFWPLANKSSSVLQGWGACGAKPGVTGLHKDGGASWLEAKCSGLDCTACGQHREASSRWLEEQQVGEASCRAIFINCKLYGFI